MIKYTKESFLLELQKRFPNNNIEIIEFNGAYKPIKYRCLSCGKIIYKSRANHLYENKTLCQHCFSPKNSKIREWIINFFDNSVQFKLLSWSKNTIDKLYIHCNNCNLDFYKMPNNIFKKEENTICPNCGNNGAPVPQILYEQQMKINGYNDYKILNYKSISQSVTFQHSCGYVFSQIGNNFLKSRGCPKCAGRISKGEMIIENYLKNNKIKYFYNFKVKEINNLSYDFYLPDYNIFIEYQGQQHFYPINYFGGEEKFLLQLKHDKIKEEYAKKNNYKLIIIPYTDFDNIESYLIPVGSTTSLNDVISSEMKEKSII